MIPALATHLPRAVAPLFADMLWRVSTKEPQLYLTFDDGPSPQVTPAILDVLAKHGAKGTFFLVGQDAAHRPDLVRRLVEGGHTLGNHSYTHLDPWGAERTRLMKEFSDTTALLESISGQPVRFARPPYGRFTPAFRAWCSANTQRLTMWDVMPGDFLPNRTQAALEAFMLAKVRPGSIIVLHDGPSIGAHVIRALDSVLGSLRTEGWRFLSLEPEGEAFHRPGVTG